MSGTMKLKFILLLCLFDRMESQKPDYCRPTLCSSNRKHIACDNNGTLDTSCPPDAQVQPVTTRIRNVILSVHNRLRDRIASGKEPKYKPAARMARITWSTELAELAKLNVQTCRMALDNCRNTDAFPYVGQNVALYAYDPAGRNYTVEEISLKHFQKWQNELRDGSMSVINSFSRNGEDGKSIAHFLQMIQAASTHIGCAFLRQTKDEMIEQLMACNYARGNIQRRPVYVESNTPGSGCKSGIDERFTSLCGLNEKFDDL